jgi:DNA-directed RNA polymerase alpha subunit
MNYDAEFLAWVDQSTLTDRTKIAVHLRAEGLTLRGVGDVLGVGPERIRQMCRKAERRFAERHAMLEARARADAEKSLRQVELGEHLSAPWASWTANDLEFSVRAHNCMRNHNLTLGDVAKMTDKELLSVPNLGRKSLMELRGVVARTIADYGP